MMQPPWALCGACKQPWASCCTFACRCAAKHCCVFPHSTLACPDADQTVRSSKSDSPSRRCMKPAGCSRSCDLTFTYSSVTLATLWLSECSPSCYTMLPLQYGVARLSVSLAEALVSRQTCLQLLIAWTSSCQWRQASPAILTARWQMQGM